MKVTPIATPLPGERLVAIAPPMAIQVDAGWRKRLNLYTGRTLSDVALTAEQASRAGRLATVAEMLSPGIVSGLGIGIEDTQQNSAPVQVLHVAAGAGLTAWGEDVVVPHALRVLVTDLVPVAQRVGLTLGVLVLEPVRVRRAGRFDASDPCDVDNSDDAFSDEQDVDACRLVYLPWDPAWGPPVSGLATLTWRNRAAYQIFAMESALPFGEVLPWELRGVPIGLLAFAAPPAIGPLRVGWLDRNAVTRAGGKAKNRAPLVAGAGNPFIWQARLLQFAEQLGSQSALTVDQRVGSYLQLPPAGLLPREAVDLVARKAPFFPPTWAVCAAPLPLEQLDEMIDRSSSLAPITTTNGERVILLVPVPQSVYEPGLLVTEAVAPIFQQRIAQFTAARDASRAVRLAVRIDYRALVHAIDGLAVVPKYFDTDPGTPQEPDALPDEPTVAPVANDAADGGRFGVEGTGPALTALAVTAIKTLRTQLQHLNGATPQPIFTAAELADFDSDAGLAAFVTKMTAKVQQADDTIDFSFLKAHPNIYRIRQQLLGSTAATRLATSPVLASIAQGDSAEAISDEVNRYFVAIKGHAPPGTLGSVALANAALTAPPLALAAAAPTTAKATAKRAATAAATASATLGAAIASATITKTIRPVKKLLPTTIALGVAPIVDREIPTLGNTGFNVSAGGVVSRDPVVLPPPPTTTTVQEASPVAGDGAYNFRTVSIAQRIDDPPSSEAKAYAVAARTEALQDLELLSELGMNLDDIPVFGVPKYVNDQPVYYPKFVTPTGIETDVAKPNNLPNPRASLPFRGSVPFGTVRAGNITRLLKDPPPINADEGNFFSEAVTVIENMIATLRAIEGRVAAYKADLTLCQQTLDQVNALKAAAATRLAGLDNDVLEDRHKVATARALLADETARVAAINTRRAAVLREHVTFLAYIRPRYMDARVDTPVLHLNPGLTEAPVPECLAAHDNVPPEIEQMVQVLREAPIAWFTDLPPTLEKLDRVELLHGTLQVAKTRASVMRDAGAVPATFVQVNTSGRFGPAIAKVTSAQQQVVANLRLQVAALDLSRFAGLGWRQSEEAAVDILSLGDLIEGNHGRSTVANAAADELSQVTRIAACLYTQACDVLPAIRLEWSDRLSQYDKTFSLRDLTVLPRWGEVDFTLRQQMQGLADWLYARIVPTETDGVSWMHDLVRVALLLASDAPVNEIIAGQVPSPTPAAPGRTVPVAIDPTRVRLGMKVFFYKQNQVVAHGVVEDLVGTQARTRIAETLADNVTLDVGTRAQFVHPEARDVPTFLRKIV